MRTGVVKLAAAVSGVAVLVLALSGCVYGPKTEKKSPLNVLNGENYDNSAETGTPDRILIPVMKTKQRTTHLSGRVIRREGLVEVPLRNVAVALYSSSTIGSEATGPEAKPLQEVVSDSDGEFRLAGTFRNGTYRLRLRSERYRGELGFEVNDYEVQNLLVLAQERGPQGQR